MAFKLFFDVEWAELSLLKNNNLMEVLETELWKIDDQDMCVEAMTDKTDFDFLKNW